jgi:preprotein translocase subunit SecA
MAGRGTDIKLGKGVKENGGLAIVGTERHESRRIDRQLRGRAGRQGDPGQSQFYVSLEDDLMRLFGTERISKIMDRMGLEEGEVIQHSMITRSISNAQKKVEENNFGMRKRLLEYDDVMNSQREVIYKRRRNALYGDRIKVDLDIMLKEFCQEMIEIHIDMTDAEGLKFDAIRFLRVDPEISESDLNDMRPDELAEKLYEKATAYYGRKSDVLAETLFNGITRIKKDNPKVQWIRIPFSDGAKKFQIDIEVERALETKGKVVIDELEKIATLHIIDDNWKDHLRTMDDLRRDVQNAVYEQKDPLLVYKIQSFEVFRQMLAKVNQEVLSLIFKTDLHIEGSQQSQEQLSTKKDDFSKLKAKHKDATNDRERRIEQEKRVMAAAGGGEPERKLSRAQRRAQERKKKKRR